MDKKQIEEIRSRAEAATPGPWHNYDRGIGYEVHVGPATEKHWWQAGEDGHERGGECSCIHDGFRETIPNEQNADFIAHARQDIPDLLDALEAAQKRIAELEGVMRSIIGERDPNGFYPCGCELYGFSPANHEDGCYIRLAATTLHTAGNV